MSWSRTAEDYFAACFLFSCTIVTFGGSAQVAVQFKPFCFLEGCHSCTFMDLLQPELGAKAMLGILCWQTCAGRPVLADDLIRFDLIASDSLGRKSGVATSLPAHCRALQKGVKNVGKTQATRGLHLAMCRRAGDLAALNMFERPHLKTLWCPRHINIHQLPSIRGGPCFVVQQYSVYIFDWKVTIPSTHSLTGFVDSKASQGLGSNAENTKSLDILVRLDTSWYVLTSWRLDVLILYRGMQRRPKSSCASTRVAQGWSN